MYDSGYEQTTDESQVYGPGFALLTSEETFRATWPDSYTAHHELQVQIQERARQMAALETAFSKVPAATEFEEAIEANALSAAVAMELYSQLSSLLAQRDYERAVLYLPFEIMLRDGYEPSDAVITESHRAFQRSYMNAWYNLLETLDVRANFVDGDIPEAELRSEDLPRVVKAIHLVPILIEKGWLTVEEVESLAICAENPTLVEDIANALTVVRYKTQQDELEEPPKKPTILTEELVRRYGDSLDPTLPPGRRQWLIEKHRQDAIDTCAHQLVSSVMSSGEGQTLDLSSLYSDTINAELYIETARLVFIRLSDQNPLQAAEWADKLSTIVGDAFSELSDEAKKRARTLMRHLYAYGAIPLDSLSQLQITTQQFNNSYGANSVELLPQANSVIDLVKDDPILSEVLFEVVALGGSRVKGYGELESDDDITLFVKTPAARADREVITNHVIQTFAQAGKERPTLVWLSQTDGSLTVVVPDESDDAYTADRFWTHTLFNTVWVGANHDITTLQQSLLPGYFYTLDEHGNEIPERKYYLERLEQDSLQYRLMHKGYRRHMPELGMPQWNHGELLDSKSVFWDSGYRRVASLLFLKTVFLPSIS